MAFIRKRTTSSGNLSTALVEPYRDSAGKPRQRVLANLYGCETTLEALAKISAQRQRLRQEHKEIESMLAETAEWAAVAVRFATDPAEMKRVGVTTQDYRDINRVMKARKKAHARTDRIGALLSRVQKDGAVIRKHVDASEQEIQQAIREYQERLDKAEKTIMGTEFGIAVAKRELARLSLPGETHKKMDKDFIRSMVAKVE